MNTGQAACAPGARDFSSIVAELHGLDLDASSMSVYRSYERLLRGLTDQATRIAYLSNFTIEPLPAFVTVRAAREGLATSSFVGGIGQHMQAILDPASGLGEAKAEVIVLALSPRLLRPADFDAFTALSAEARSDLRDEILAHVEDWVALALERTEATLIVSNFVSPLQPALGVADTSATMGETEFYLDLNLSLIRRWRGEPRVQILDADRLAARVGKDRVFDARMLHLAKMEWSETMLRAVATEVVRHIRAAKGMARKCLVLDLDNTLWGGIVGEDGPAGIKVGPGDPQGEAYAAFQTRIRALRDRGILLALCSKNNPADVEEAFALRTEMPLKRTDFVAAAVGWEAKYLGLQQIARDLSIGTDSLVFIDDNPAEIALVREMLPEVETLLLPSDPAGFVAALDALTAFEKSVVLADDVDKSVQYRQRQERQAFAQGTGDLASYLSGLGTQVSIRSASPSDVTRVHQLFTKTNQFNLTTKRYTVANVEHFIESADHELIVVSASDRFGDLGLIAVCLIERGKAELTLDSFLMSCRAMGRGIETAVMNYIKAIFVADGNARTLVGTFVPTAKNPPAAAFLETEGFTLESAEPDGAKRYRLARSQAQPKECPWIEVLS